MLGFLENDGIGFISLWYSHHVVGYGVLPAYQYCGCIFLPVEIFADSAIDRRSSKQIDWNSSYGDLVQRAYWHCAILETGLHLELDLPLTGLLDHEVNNITFQHPSSYEDEVADEVTQFRAHYHSQLTLRRLCAELHDKINECRSSTIYSCSLCCK